MDKRYQVFVSSTFEDLRDERQAVILALLELECIPYGMELFPAADDDQWTFIKRAIDDCDYYLVIVAGRYGSLGSAGKSFTQMEYEYAIERGKPTIAFIHGEPGKLIADRVEASDRGKEQLRDFKALLQQRLCKHWASAPELASVVSRSMIQLKVQRPAVGWVRANLVADESAAQEINTLRRKIDTLEEQLERFAISAPLGTEHLAQLSDRIDLTFESPQGHQERERTRTLTWKQIFLLLGSQMLARAESEFSLGLVIEGSERQNQRSMQNVYLRSPKLPMLLLHLEALGLVRPFDMATENQMASWMLTPYGRRVLLTEGAFLKGGT